LASPSQNNNNKKIKKLKKKKIKISKIIALSVLLPIAEPVGLGPTGPRPYLNFHPPPPPPPPKKKKEKKKKKSYVLEYVRKGTARLISFNFTAF
jgi:hypothetical protein